jgi:hypothetical protein
MNELIKKNSVEAAKVLWVLSTTATLVIMWTVLLKLPPWMMMMIYPFFQMDD